MEMAKGGAAVGTSRLAASIEYLCFGVMCTKGDLHPTRIACETEVIRTYPDVAIPTEYPVEVTCHRRLLPNALVNHCLTFEA